MIQRKQNIGFTLIELMVSIAIVVVLMVGVAQVFQYTGQAVGANQQMSDAVRNDRAIQSTLAMEVQQIAQDSPILMIRGEVIGAYRNKIDEASDPNPGTPLTWEQRFTDTGANPVMFPASPNERVHRVDRLAFMARGMFPRQTGNDGVFMANQTSSEAFIWYGHLCLPHTNGQFHLSGATTGPKTNPGTSSFASNPQNYFASQWCLGHVATKLVVPTGIPAANPGTISANGINQYFIARDLSNGSFTYLAPLSENSSASNGSVTDGKLSQHCRYDLAGTSIANFAAIMRRAIGTPWQAGVNYQAGNRVSHRGFTYLCSSPHTSGFANQPTALGSASPWGAPILSEGDWWTDIFMQTRYECNPFVVKPLDSESFSQQAPVFAQACTQFMVEFAGDFLKQDNDPESRTYGYVINTFDNPVDSSTDGETDFVVNWVDANNDGLIDPNERKSIRRQVRWYGLPRDVDGNGIVRGYDEAAGTLPQFLSDVVPFRDVAMTIHTVANINTAPFNTLPFAANAKTFYDPTNGVNSYIGAPFERFLPQGTETMIQRKRFYMNNNSLDSGYDPNNASGMPIGQDYQCAWGPYDTVRPKMLRIIVTLDDPNSRFAEGQTFEYVYKLP